MIGDRPVRAVYVLSVFASAALLFSVEPLVGKAVLPVLGGSPAVWNVCMVFFQAVLLAGYGYAHHLTRARNRWLQGGVHLVLLAAVATRLPLDVVRLRAQVASTHPIVALLGTLAGVVGLAFLALSATGPLLQRWYARSAASGGRDPYALYAASNLGSLAALAAYPLLVEPRWPLPVQARAWSWAFLAVAALLAVAFLSFARRPALAPARATPAAAPTSARARLSWVFLAFVPSSLTLGVTTYLSVDLGSAPLLWTAPLALYLLSFVVVFARRRVVRTSTVIQALAGLTLFASVATANRLDTVPLAAAVALHLACLFVVALVCHGRLADVRPPEGRLTEFYFLLAIGGALGGVFNAVIAPSLFDWLFEYPLVLGLANLARVADARARRPGRGDLAIAAAAVALLGASVWLIRARHLQDHYFWFNLPFLGLALAALARPVAYAALIAALPAIALQLEGTAADRHTSRSLFGVHVVYREGGSTVYRNGTTIHGRQNLAPDRACEPLAYYHRDSPVADVLAHPPTERPLRDVAVIGLGAGTLASYAGPGQRWVFFEIDPEVARIAQDPARFTFLSRCPSPQARVDVRIADGRLAVASAPDAAFDALVVDAFSSDTIPVHLLTREALDLYRRKVRPGGVIVMHVSNRYYDVEPLLAALTTDLGLRARLRDDLLLSDEAERAGKLPSTWVAVTADAAVEARLAARPGWRELAGASGAPRWTDDASSLLQVVRWR